MPPCFVHSQQQLIPATNDNDNMLLLTPPPTKCTHLALSSCPPPPRVRHTKLSHFNSMKTNDGSNFNEVRSVMFPALPQLYTNQSQGSEQTRTRHSYQLTLKPRPMHGSTAFARMSSTSTSPRWDGEQGEDAEAMHKVSIGKVSKEAAAHSNLLGCVKNRRSFYSRAS